MVAGTGKAKKTVKSTKKTPVALKPNPDLEYAAHPDDSPTDAQFKKLVRISATVLWERITWPWILRRAEYIEMAEKRIKKAQEFDASKADLANLAERLWTELIADPSKQNKYVATFPGVIVALQEWEKAYPDKIPPCPGITLSGHVLGNYDEGARNIINVTLNVVSDYNSFSIVAAKGWKEWLPWHEIDSTIRHNTCCVPSPAHACHAVCVDAIIEILLGEDSYERLAQST